MYQYSEHFKNDINAFLEIQEERSLLRFITCGSVDDGKSTLIGRLLWDSKLIFEDQLAALEVDSKKNGTQKGDIDFALLMDGLQAEREQGITIDVAYRFFTTDKRKFIVADTPGHEQYTRNMVTGATTAQAAVILIDARKGVLTQSRRHSYLVSLVGIKNVVLAVNKMDLVGYDESRFETIRKEYESFAARLGFERITAIPISALKGDNVIEVSHKTTPWYKGPSLLKYLENVELDDTVSRSPFRMRVQWVNRPSLNFRGYSGTVASGCIRPGDGILVTSSGRMNRVSRIVSMDGDLEEAVAGQAITLTLEDEVDISRGDLLAAPDARPSHSDRFKANLVWLHEQPLRQGRGYILKAGAATAPVTVEELDHKVNVNTLQKESGSELQMNEVGVGILNIGKEISFDTYDENHTSGSFILIDRMTNATVGAGMIAASLEPGRRTSTEAGIMDAGKRAALKGQKAGILWFTGVNYTRKPALAGAVKKKLCELGFHTHLLVDEHLRDTLNSDLKDTVQDRAEELRRLVAVARVCAEAGLIVLVKSRLGFTSGQTSGDIVIVPSGQREDRLKDQVESIIREYIFHESGSFIPDIPEIVSK